MMDVSPDELPLLYSWIDGIPLSRPKRNIARDFSDAVLVAEVVAHYCPKLVDAHNYSAANGLAQKVYNWNTLNVKVFRRLHFSLTKDDIEAVANCEPQMIERILKLLKYKMAKYKPNGLSGEPVKPQKPEEQYPSNAKTRCLGAASLMRLAQVNQPKEQENRENLRPVQGRESRARQATPSKVHSSQDQYPSARAPSPRRSQEVNFEKLREKDAHIRELGETIELLEAKVKKLEQLVRLKEHKIQVLSGKLTLKGGRP
ncbi:sperm flagellar protein 1 [Marchantia polymorpha subsp. ruderalis]|uniref:Calponin-homology (CH) domain-containing protein n=2 Tax=Marchantia polymorpha TaxID=3197 RepID=A0AAF6BI92_MARPO|nr:hypothetical protein MARPO_0032s0117 [Marchantia polymorpha]BBN11726.1 hypothetical protein Mp_5g14250 [Marchantia polymorpha subsp. ruderalis]|eukprot:PTQ41943.1 hypothetical protein MARPO_0032s0117 [Marchantia polymorpha]